MTFSQTEINNVNSARFSTQNEVAGLNISVDESPLMHLANTSEHFYQNLNSYFERVVLVETSARLGQVDSHEVHDNEVLLRVVDEVVDVRDVLETFETIEDLVLKNEDVLVLVLLFHFDSHVLLQHLVVCLVDLAYINSLSLLKVP